MSEVEKDVFRLVTSVRQRKNSESPCGIEPQTFGFPRSNASPQSPRDSTMELGLLRSSYDKRPAYY